ncbi:MAG: hypothetical protein RIT40_1023, partial [Planctomycetota bacterium]
ALEVGAEAFDGAAALFEAGSDRAGYPVEVAELVEEGAAHAQVAVAFEGHTAFGIEGRDGVHEAYLGGCFQIATIHGRRQALSEAAHDVERERLVVNDQRVAFDFAAATAKGTPQASDGILRARCTLDLWLG